MQRWILAARLPGYEIELIADYRNIAFSVFYATLRKVWPSEDGIFEPAKAQHTGRLGSTLTVLNNWVADTSTIPRLLE